MPDQVKGVATTHGARPWQETDLQQTAWDQFLKVHAPYGLFSSLCPSCIFSSLGVYCTLV